MKSSERKKMLVIGFGRIGKVYIKLFADTFSVNVISSRNVSEEIAELGARQAASLDKAVAEAEYIVLAMPLHALQEAVDSIKPLVRTETIVFDTTSAKVKTLPILAKLNCRYFSTHLKSPQKMVMCGQSDALIEKCLREKGMEVIHMSAEEHDKRNGLIGMAQFLGLVLGQELDNDDRAILSESKSGQLLVSLIDHIASNVPTTYQETQLDNAFTAKQRIRLISSLQNYDEQLIKGRFPAKP